MEKKEFVVTQLNLAYIALGEVCNNLVHFPELKKKAEVMREEVRQEYEKQYNEWTDGH